MDIIYLLVLSSLPRGRLIEAFSPPAAPICSPAVRTPENINQIRSDIESFLLTLPLGSDAASADIEAAVAERLYEVWGLIWGYLYRGLGCEADGERMMGRA